MNVDGTYTLKIDTGSDDVKAVLSRDGRELPPAEALQVATVAGGLIARAAADDQPARLA